MGLEEGSTDCDGSCSSLDAIGCELVSHQEANRQFDEAIRRLPLEKYAGFMDYIETNHPRVYRALKRIGF